MPVEHTSRWKNAQMRQKILERASAALLPVHLRAQTILIGRLRRAVSTVFEGQIAAVYESCNISAHSSIPTATAAAAVVCSDRV